MKFEMLMIKCELRQVNKLVVKVFEVGCFKQDGDK